MSKFARWIVGGFSLFCALSFASLAIFYPGTFNPDGIIGKVLLVAFPLFCLGVAVVCIEGPLQEWAARFVAFSIFAVSVLYFVTEIGSPLPSLATYRRSQANLFNAAVFFLIVGLPSARIAFFKYPNSPGGREKFESDSKDYNEEDEEHEDGVG